MSEEPVHYSGDDVALPIGTLVLIDSQALYFALRERFGKTSRADYKKVREKIESYFADDPEHSYADFQVHVMAYQNFNVKDFVSMLQRFGYHVRKKDIATLETSGQGTNTKNNSCSTEVIAEAIRKKDRYQRFIFVSGEGALLPAVRVLREAGKAVWVACLTDGLNSTLAEEIDFFISLDDKSIIWAGSNSD